MAKYLSLRGWIECDEQNIEEIKKRLIENQENIDRYPLDIEQAKHYSEGWRFPENSVGLTSKGELDFPKVNQRRVRLR